MSDRRPVPFRGGGFNPVPRRALPWIVFAMLIALWQAASSSGLLPALFLPSPLAVVKALQRCGSTARWWSTSPPR